MKRMCVCTFSDRLGHRSPGRRLAHLPPRHPSQRRDRRADRRRAAWLELVWQVAVAAAARLGRAGQVGRLRRHPRPALDAELRPGVPRGRRRRADLVRLLGRRFGPLPRRRHRQTAMAYTTDGPVRIAPTGADGLLYFGSDDGHAYCLKADDGSLVWKHAPGSRQRLVLNNGRPIPLWPCRTGVLVDGGTAYFAAGMLPWQDSYLCAVDARTGKPEGTGRYVRASSRPDHGRRPAGFRQSGSTCPRAACRRCCSTAPTGNAAGAAQERRGRLLPAADRRRPRAARAGQQDRLDHRQQPEPAASRWPASPAATPWSSPAAPPTC